MNIIPRPELSEMNGISYGVLERRVKHASVLKDDKLQQLVDDMTIAILAAHRQEMFGDMNITGRLSVIETVTKCVSRPLYCDNEVYEQYLNQGLHIPAILTSIQTMIQKTRDFNDKQRRLASMECEELFGYSRP